MLQCHTADRAIELIRKANDEGADAYGLQVEVLKPEYQSPEVIKSIIDEMQGRPVYLTNYRYSSNTGKTDEQLAEELVALAQEGTLCDVMGDMFCRHPEELTDNEDAIKKQMALIEKLHKKGAEVLMSSHLYKYAPSDRVLEIAFEQKRRGADIIKIVTNGNDMAEQLENLETTARLKRELQKPFLFLSGGECSIHRRVGIKLGCCMGLCVYEHDALSTPAQPLLSTLKLMREEL